MKRDPHLNDNILGILRKAKNPISTREIAVQVDHAWHTVLTKLLRLQIAGKVDGFKAGNMHLWIIKKK